MGREKKIAMKETLHIEIHGNSDNDYPHGNKHKEGNNWKMKEVPVKRLKTLAQVHVNAAEVGGGGGEGERRSKGWSVEWHERQRFSEEPGRVLQSLPGRHSTLNPAAWEGEGDLETI